MNMKTIVTRNGQVTISKEYREKLEIHEGTPLQMHLMGNMIILKKTTPEYWKNFKGGFLPANFEEIRETWRGDELKRLKKLGILK